MLRSAVLHFYDTLSLWAPSLCTMAALTWTRALWGVEIKRELSLGVAKSQEKGVRVAPPILVHVFVCVYERNCVWSLDGGTSLQCAFIYASKSAPRCVHLCKRRVFAKREGLFSLLIIHQQRPYMSVLEALSPTDPDTLLRGSSWRKETRKEAWYTHCMGSSTNQLFKY